MSAWRLLTAGVFLFMTLSIGTPGLVTAGDDTAALLDKAKTQISNQEYQDALKTIHEAMLQVWDKCPMFVSNAVLVTSKALGFGMYQERPDNIFKKNEPILIYLQPAGYSIRREGDMYALGFEADFVLMDTKGKILGGKRDFGKWTWKSHNPNFEIFMNLTFTLTGVPEGEYVIECVIRDINSKKQASLKKKIVIQ